MRWAAFRLTDHPACTYTVLYDPFLSGPTITDAAPAPCEQAFGEENHTASMGPGCSKKCEIAVKPQMKKYRSLWCVSTTNHNILYFVGILGICPLNPAIYLWKLTKGLVWRGLKRFNPPQNHSKFTLQAFRRHFSSLFPAPARYKTQKQCIFSDFPVQMWTFGAISQPHRKHGPACHRTRGRIVEAAELDRNYLPALVSILIP
jgi:hypothetical protein